MYKFLRILFDADDGTSGNEDRDARLASLVAAARSALPDDVLYPAPGSVVNIDSRTGRALEELWRETAEIHGSEYAPEMTDADTNPLCRGVYVFCDPHDGTPRPFSYEVWDNRDGDALTGYTDSMAVAEHAAGIIARGEAGDGGIDECLERARIDVSQVMDSHIEDAHLRRTLEAAGRVADLARAGFKDYSEIDALADACEDLTTLRCLDLDLADGVDILSGEYILDHADVNMDKISDTAFYDSLIDRVCELSRATRTIDMDAVDESTRRPDFWRELSGGGDGDKGAKGTSVAQLSELYGIQGGTDGPPLEQVRGEER